MNSLALFGIFAVVLLYIAFMFLLPVLSRSNYETRNTGNPLNKRLYRQKQDELDADLKSGEIGQDEYEEAVLELKKRLLADSRDDELPGATSAREKRYQYLVALLVLFPGVVAVLYWTLGDPESLGRKSAHPSFSQGDKATAATTQAGSERRKQTLELIDKLEKRLQKHPAETRTMVFLARAYQSVGLFRKAAGIYQRLLPTHKTDPDFLTSYADALAVVHGGKISGQALQLVHQALKIKPNHIKALHLAGTAYYRKAEYNKALLYWQRLIGQLPSGSSYAKTIRSIIVETEQRIKSGKGIRKAGSKSAQAVVIRGTVELDKSLQAKTKPDDTVFVFARAVNGSRMPLAVLKTSVKNLPYQFVLDSNSAMSNLRAGTKVIIVARVSKSGSVKQQAGDLEGQSEEYTTGSTKKLLVIINKKL